MIHKRKLCRVWLLAVTYSTYKQTSSSLTYLRWKTPLIYKYNVLFLCICPHLQGDSNEEAVEQEICLIIAADALL